MVYYYDRLHVQALRDPPQTLTVDSWTINYIGFCRPENRHKTPLVILGGAFQVFHSFLSDIKAYLPHVPVILIALPGQSSNSGKRDASALSLQDMADLLEGCFARLGLEKVVLAGFSYGSLTAYSYAYAYEHRLEKLILVGCSLRLRHTLRQLIRHGMEGCCPEHLSEIAETMSQSLFNLNACAITGVTMELVSRLIASIRRLSPKEQEDYRANSQRLLDAQVPLRNFSVRTLVLSTLYDHFVMPHESEEVARLFPNGDFVLIEKADHLVPLKAPHLVQQTVLQFLEHRPYEGDGIHSGAQAIELVTQRRRQVRYPVAGLAVRLHGQDGSLLEGVMDAISYDGCGLRLSDRPECQGELDGTWWLEVPHLAFRSPGFLTIQSGKACFVFFKRTLASRDDISHFVSELLTASPEGSLPAA